MLIKPTTEEEKKVWPKDVIVKMDESFQDPRGGIQPLVNLPMESCVIINSKKGTIRANHYHKTDWHYCYILEGTIDYYHRPVNSSDIPEKVIVKAGQLFFTPPMVEHAMVFHEDTIFLTLGRNSREQEVYEMDVVRVDLISPEQVFK